jgi:hypothetical protein
MSLWASLGNAQKEAIHKTLTQKRKKKKWSLRFREQRLQYDNWSGKVRYALGRVAQLSPRVQLSKDVDKQSSKIERDSSRQSNASKSKPPKQPAAS